MEVDEVHGILVFVEQDRDVAQIEQALYMDAKVTRA
jgi:hypothetical protein